MSTTSTESDLTLVDSRASLVPLLDSIANLTVDPPSLYMDLKGIELGRHGTISILSLCTVHDKKIYLIDIHTLGKAASSVATCKGTSLKTILESSTIPKVFLDVRKDSNVLFSLFHISVDGIKDLQLMEVATRPHSWEVASTLAKCIDKHSPISAEAKTEWLIVKERGFRLLEPEKGGSYEVLSDRPLRPEIIQ